MGKNLTHNWAHQLKDSEKYGNTSFDGPCFYSYSTVIGQILKLENKSTIYLLNTGKYSNSTTGHQHYMRSAIPGDANIFSASCDNFIYWWQGIYNFDKTEQEKLLTKYLKKQLDHFQAFLDSTTLETERNWSLRWWEEAKKFIEVTKCCTLKQLLKQTNDTFKKRDITKPTQFRVMVQTLIRHDEGLYTLPKMIDLICGKGAYEKYVDRTKGARSSEYTRKINCLLGFKSNYRYDSYWSPYDFKEQPSSFGIHYLKGNVEGGINKKTIEKLRKSGNYLSFLLQTKRDNFHKNMEYTERKNRTERVRQAKERFESHLGLTGFNSYWDKKRTNFNYNGTIIRYEGWHKRKELTLAEYVQYSVLSPEEQATWRFDKKQWMLEQLQEETRQHEEWEAHKEQERTAKERAAEERRILIEQKADYIKEQEEKGEEGVRQLWHENLKDKLPYSLGAAFFYGGNTLLRIAGGIVETSKGIRIDIEECERLWKLINLWHTNQKEFTPNAEKAIALNSSWVIKRYQNDILITGCHSIAYCEMKSIAKQLGFI
jgi:hypothetical protein